MCWSKNSCFPLEHYTNLSTGVSCQERNQKDTERNKLLYRLFVPRRKPEGERKEQTSLQVFCAKRKPRRGKKRPNFATGFLCQAKEEHPCTQRTAFIIAPLQLGASQAPKCRFSRCQKTALARTTMHKRVNVARRFGVY